MIPGSNLLNMALGVIGSQPVLYYRDSQQREELPNGVLVTKFDPGRTIPRGSVQAISQYKVEQMGLDMSKHYVEWLVSRDVLGVERNASGDQMVWSGKRYTVVEVEQWSPQDGWCAAVCQEM